MRKSPWIQRRARGRPALVERAPIPHESLPDRHEGWVDAWGNPPGECVPAPLHEGCVDLRLPLRGRQPRPLPQPLALPPVRVHACECAHYLQRLLRRARVRLAQRPQVAHVLEQKRVGGPVFVHAPVAGGDASGTLRARFAVPVDLRLDDHPGPGRQVLGHVHERRNLRHEARGRIPVCPLVRGGHADGLADVAAPHAHVPDVHRAHAALGQVALRSKRVRQPLRSDPYLSATGSMRPSFAWLRVNVGSFRRWRFRSSAQQLSRLRIHDRFDVPLRHDRDQRDPRLDHLVERLALLCSRFRRR